MVIAFQSLCRRLFCGLVRKLEGLRPSTEFDPAAVRFIRHNKKYWTANSSRELTGEVLFEFTTMEPSVVAYSYFANILSRKYGAKVKSYCMKKQSAVDRSFQYLYKSFNAPIFFCSLNKAQEKELITLYSAVYSKLENKKDVFDLEIMSIHLGDLIYDHHLKENNVPTVDINDGTFRASLKLGLSHFIFWRDYLKCHDVKAINVTHCAYLLAIPLRIAIHLNIPAYQCNAHGIYGLSSDRLWAYTEFDQYPVRFRRLSDIRQKKILAIAKENIARRFAGEVGVDMQYSTKSAYTTQRGRDVIRPSDKLKVLVAPHCFFDSPNGLGRNLFIDFYEWAEFLGEVSEKTNYDWYIKTHPDARPGNVPIWEELSKKYPKFTLIPAETSHHQLIEQAIDVVLTVYGTIGFEYAALKKLVVNASLVNPHIAYNFNLHPGTIEEYQSIVMDLGNQELDISIDEVYEYYGMKHVANDGENWLFDQYKNMVTSIGYKSHFSPICYDYFIDQFQVEDHEKRLKLLENFIDSGDYFMSVDHEAVA